MNNCLLVVTQHVLLQWYIMSRKHCQNIQCWFYQRLYNRYLCRKHFLEKEFKTFERICLMKVRVSCDWDSTGNLIPEHSLSSLYIIPFNSLSFILPHDGDLHALHPTRINSNINVTSFAVTVSPICTEGPSTSSLIPPLASLTCKNAVILVLNSSHTSIFKSGEDPLHYHWWSLERWYHSGWIQADLLLGYCTM